MCADWYSPSIFYGYTFIIPDDSSYRSIAKQLFEITAFVTAPFEIVGLLPLFHSRLEFDENGNRDMDRYAILIIGFKPESDLELNKQRGIELAEYIQDNPILTGFDIFPGARFYSGIPWPPNTDDGESEDHDTSYSSSDDFPSDSDHSFDYQEEEDDSEEGDWEEEKEEEDNANHSE